MHFPFHPCNRAHSSPSCPIKLKNLGKWNETSKSWLLLWLTWYDLYYNLDPVLLLLLQLPPTDIFPIPFSLLSLLRLALVKYATGSSRDMYVHMHTRIVMNNGLTAQTHPYEPWLDAWMLRLLVCSALLMTTSARKRCPFPPRCFRLNTSTMKRTPNHIKKSHGEGGKKKKSNFLPQFLRSIRALKFQFFNLIYDNSEQQRRSTKHATSKFAKSSADLYMFMLAGHLAYKRLSSQWSVFFPKQGKHRWTWWAHDEYLYKRKVLCSW